MSNILSEACSSHVGLSPDTGATSENDIPPRSSGIRKNPQGKRVGSGQRLMIYNVYCQLRPNLPSKTEAIKQTAKQVAVGETLVWKVIKEMNKTGSLKSPNKKRERPETFKTLTEHHKNMIRTIVHDFFRKGELPTLNKIFKAVQTNENIPPMSRTTLYHILKKLGFMYEKRCRNHLLVEKPEIVLWRRRYLKSIEDFRREGRKIYFLDETWINAGHTKEKIWKDKNIRTARQAFNEGLTVGLRDPSGKGRRLIILHIGSDSGFVDGGLLLFESKRTGDYHEDMDSEKFESWMEKVLPLLEENSVIVMDNAPYHSKKEERIPNSNWKKDDIINFLSNKGIETQNLLKVELLAIVKDYLSQNPVLYRIDKMVEATGRTVLRLPPYHCKLNPIELIWAQLKTYVASNNSTFKLADVKKLFEEALNKVTADDWKKCVDHTIKEERMLYNLDNTMETVIENFVFRVNTGSSEDDEPEIPDY